MLNFEMTFKNPYANFHNHQKKIWKREIENFSFLVLSIGFMAKLQKAAFLQKKKPTKKLEIPYHQSREKRTEEKSNKKLFKITENVTIKSFFAN